MNLKNKIKQVSVATALASMFYLAGCSKGELALPVSEETKTTLLEKNRSEQDTVRREYLLAREQAYASFNEAIKDGLFTIDEQKKVLQQCRDVISRGHTYEKVESNYRPDSSLESLTLLLYKNLYKVDFGVPNLERSLRQQGIPVMVEPIYNWEDKYLTGWLIMAGIAGCIMGASGIKECFDYYKRRKAQ